jgi:hypothetical protein
MPLRARASLVFRQSVQFYMDTNSTVQLVSLTTKSRADTMMACNACVYLNREDGVVGPQELEQFIDVALARQVAHEHLAWPWPPLRPPANIIILSCQLVAAILTLPVHGRVRATRPLLLVIWLSLTLLCFKCECDRCRRPGCRAGP